jgi:protein-S-isoprenylcysteine O-methyltransferase Ste14
MTEPDLTQSNRTRRLMLNVLFIIIATAGGVFVLDMWFDILSWAVMGKLLLTLLIGAGVLAVWLTLRSHIREEESMTKDKFLN